MHEIRYISTEEQSTRAVGEFDSTFVPLGIRKNQTVNGYPIPHPQKYTPGGENIPLTISRRYGHDQTGFLLSLLCWSLSG